MEFEWNDGKYRTNLQKHQIAFEDVLEVFDDPWMLEEKSVFVGEEERLDVIGRVHPESGVFFIVYTMRVGLEGQAVVRIISARPASRKERARYDRA